MFDQGRAKHLHGGVFLWAVAKWDNDSHWTAEATTRPGQRLAMIASGGGDYAAAGLLVRDCFESAAEPVRRVSDISSNFS